MSKGIWIKVFGYACYLVRRSPSTAFYLKTPFEVLLSNSAIFDFKLFSCPAYTIVNDGKLERLTTMFYGFEFGVNGFWLWFVELLSPSLLVSRVLEFDKLAILFDIRELVCADKDPGVCKQVELSVETSVKVFGSTTLFVVSRERSLPHWFGFAELVSFVLAAKNMVTASGAIWKFKHCLDLFGVADCD
ncbi:hypothetical protein TorRG33x02_203990 [Trema orientale]|uniref:Uncharacterized protein n=1 Tax=Trema orientale TaxID=63057 RepID=A0A2P5EE81_TREOI|nr:hypothetical protein TorRG33x02_203990 [Trema orientale]